MNAEITASSGATKSKKTPQDADEEGAAVHAGTDLDPEVENLMDQAERLRLQLGRTLEALQRKKEEMSISHQAAKHPLPFILAGVGALLAFFIGKFWGRHTRPPTPTSKPTETRAKPLGPNEVRTPPKVPHSLMGDLLRSAILSVSPFVINEVTRFAVAKITARLQAERQVR